MPLVSPVTVRVISWQPPSSGVATVVQADAGRSSPPGRCCAMAATRYSMIRGSAACSHRNVPEPTPPVAPIVRVMEDTRELHPGVLPLAAGLLGTAGRLVADEPAPGYAPAGSDADSTRSPS